MTTTIVRFLPGGSAEDRKRSETEGERSLVEPVRFGDDRRPGVEAPRSPAISSTGQEPRGHEHRAGAAA